MDSIQRLFDYKKDALNKMLLNQNIIKALVDSTPQFIDNIDSQLNDQDFRDSLLYKQVYPYIPITSTFNEEKSYIAISLGQINSTSCAITNGWIKIYVICHKGLIQTESGQRHGFIANEIDNMMYNTRGFGIGKLADKRLEEISISDNYIGVYMQYNVTDFAI